jgi:UDP-N-acetylglucosamine transferase subunit ALG13
MPAVTFDGTTPTVLVSVGTDHHPFDRLVRWMDGWLGARTGAEVTCLVQYGASHPPRRAWGLAYLDHPDLSQVMRGARDPRAGEHVDDHQQRFARRLADAGMVRLATSREELVRALDDALEHAEHVHLEADEVPSQPSATEAALRFGALVDDLFAARRR